MIYYKIFIQGFSTIAAPIYQLFRKNATFEWGVEQQSAMDRLKTVITTAPVLVSVDFSPSALPIILHTDASTTIGWGAILSQLQSDGNLRPARYESGIWNDIERKYDAVKLECRGLLKALRKFRFWLYGRHFKLETDAQTLVWLLNQPPNDLPNAMITRWLTYIRLFDFDVKHVAGNKNGGADALSRRGISELDPEENEDVDAYFDSKIYSITYDTLDTLQVIGRVWLLQGEYEGSDLMLGQYLETMQRPEGLSETEYRELKRKSKGFLVRDGLLFKRSRKRGMPPKRVLGRRQQRLDAIRGIHDEVAHRGVPTTFENVSRRYQWKGLYEDVREFVKSCLECQKRARIRYEEPLHPTFSLTALEKIGIDVVFMPETKDGFKFIVIARCDLTGWVEGRALKENNSRNVAKFLFEDVVCRHGCPLRAVMDGGSENLKFSKELLEDYKIKRTVISAYHPQSNGLVERGHSAIVNSLSKYCSNNIDEWPTYLPLALWADRITVRRTTGFSAFELLYGRDCLLPIDLSLPSWSVVDWEGEVTDHESLILARIRQLDQRNLHEAQAAKNLRNSRLGNKADFDANKRIRPQQLNVGDLVLLHNTILEHSHSRKLDDKWRGPYRIREIPPDSTFYRLEELDGTPLAATFAGNRLKRFYSRRELDADREEVSNTIRVGNGENDGDGGNLEEANEDRDGVGIENMDVLT